MTMRMNHIFCGSSITYENGAKVMTSFVTNLGDSETVLRTAPSLHESLNRAVKEYESLIVKKIVKKVPKYEYPNHVISSALACNLSKWGVDFDLKRSECVHISALDSQKQCGKTIYGGGLLLSDDASRRLSLAKSEALFRKRLGKEKEQKDAICWKLSDREKSIVSELNERSKD